MSSLSEPDQLLFLSSSPSPSPTPSPSPSPSPSSSTAAAEETHSESDEAGPSQTRKRTRAKRSQKARKKKKATTPQEKAIEVDIDFDLVCSHPKINYLRWCIKKINSSHPGEQLSKFGNKETLQERIYDFLGMPQNERSPIPLSASRQRISETIIFSNIDRGYKRALKWAEDSKDTSSVKSFEDCSCSRCEGKPWRSSEDEDDENRDDDGDGVDHHNDNDEDTEMNADVEDIPPKIPAITSIENAVQQVENGLIEKIYQKYHGTNHWKKLKKLYSERNVRIHIIFIFFLSYKHVLINFSFKDFIQRIPAF